MAAQHEVASQVSESFVGRRLKVLVERTADARELARAKVLSWEHGLLRQEDDSSCGGDGAQVRQAARGKVLVARGEADAPDIDGRVYVRGQLPFGEFAEVNITGHTDYDLVAEPV